MEEKQNRLLIENPKLNKIQNIYLRNSDAGFRKNPTSHSYFSFVREPAKVLQE